MAKERVEIEVDVPEGYEAIAFRAPLPGEKWLSPRGHVLWDTPLTQPRINARLILRKIEPARESRWENLYPLGSCRGMRHIERSLADETATAGRCAIIRIDYENNVPVNVALEPAEGGGA